MADGIWKRGFRERMVVFFFLFFFWAQLTNSTDRLMRGNAERERRNVSLHDDGIGMGGGGKSERKTRQKELAGNWDSER